MKVFSRPKWVWARVGGALWAALLVVLVPGPLLSQMLQVLHNEVIAQTPLGVGDYSLAVCGNGEVRAIFSECLEFVKNETLRFAVKSAVRESTARWSVKDVAPREEAEWFTVFASASDELVHLFWAGHGGVYRPGGSLQWMCLREDSVVARRTLIDTTWVGQFAGFTFFHDAFVSAQDFKIGKPVRYRIFRVHGTKVEEIPFSYGHTLEVESFAALDKRRLAVAGLFSTTLGFAYSVDTFEHWTAPALPGAYRAVAPRVAAVNGRVLLIWEDGKQGRFFPDRIRWIVGPPDGPFSQPDTLRSLDPPGVVLAPTVFSWRGRWVVVFWDETDFFGTGGHCRTMYRIFDGSKWTPAREFLPEGMIAAGAPKGTVSSNGLLHLVYGGGTDSTDVVAYATARVVFPTGVEDAGKVIPGDMRMEAAYPSPFNESTRVRYRLPRAATVSLRVLDVLGKPVRVLARGQQAAGGGTPSAGTAGTTRASPCPAAST